MIINLNYYRLDITSSRRNPIINEIEAINPNFCSIIYDKNDLEKYHKSVKEMLDKY